MDALPNTNRWRCRRNIRLPKKFVTAEQQIVPIAVDTDNKNHLKHSDGYSFSKGCIRFFIVERCLKYPFPHSGRNAIIAGKSMTCFLQSENPKSMHCLTGYAEKTKKFRLFRGRNNQKSGIRAKKWRRGWELNPHDTVLQTAPLAIRAPRLVWMSINIHDKMKKTSQISEIFAFFLDFF